jgi:hypothetical protein
VFKPEFKCRHILTGAKEEGGFPSDCRHGALAEQRLAGLRCVCCWGAQVVDLPPEGWNTWLPRINAAGLSCDARNADCGEQRGES